MNSGDGGTSVETTAFQLYGELFGRPGIQRARRILTHGDAEREPA